MTENHENDGFSGVARSRRSFIKKFAAGAFVAPVIASFALDGMASAAPVPNLPNQGFPNQGFPNQSCPNQIFPNQGFPNQGFPNQGFPNQGFPNQGPPGLGDERERLREIEAELRREVDCRLNHFSGCTCSLPG
jgi:hypothetical protein